MFSSVLLLKQCFEQAERSEAGWTLTTNMPATEDRRLLQEVQDWDRTVHQDGRMAPPLRAKAAVESRSGGGSSRSLRPVGQVQDPKLLADLQNTRDEASSLQERFQRMQVQTSQILREKSALQAQVRHPTAWRLVPGASSSAGG